MEDDSSGFVGEAHLTFIDMFLSFFAGLPIKLGWVSIIGAGLGTLMGLQHLWGPAPIFGFVGTIAYMVFFASALVALMVPINAAVCALRLSEKQKHCIYTLDDRGHKITDNADMALGVGWPQISWARIGKRAILLKVKKVGIRWIPLRAYSSEQIAALPEFLASHTRLK